ncbi:hypothetical protein [Oligosphaera ethanolica]|uniref:Transposase n=1 Tax=Oligosphaera ethanolica TaxID=760260 RepID=A0AAE3VHS4_9BACT|nr:hypothetical protein [Oligosphaera ethanolica]MDQ0290511.1 hypothetical protein [Oligosphaera ethanolica]
MKTLTVVHPQEVPQMNKKKRPFTPEFKAKVALAILKSAPCGVASM